jgi:hypothetical protein
MGLVVSLVSVLVLVVGNVLRIGQNTTFLRQTLESFVTQKSNRSSSFFLSVGHYVGSPVAFDRQKLMKTLCHEMTNTKWKFEEDEECL